VTQPVRQLVLAVHARVDVEIFVAVKVLKCTKSGKTRLQSPTRRRKSESWNTPLPTDLPMIRTQNLETLVQNLQVLAESFDSISDFCERVGVNRQQFNKYLAARHLPSQKVLTKISRHFHMQAEDLFRTPEDFKSFYEGVDREVPDLRAFPELLSLLDSAAANAPELARYHGTYFRYHCSSIVKGKILRSVTHLYEKDGRTQYSTVERFPMSRAAGGTDWFSFTFHGFCVLLGDRLFMMDFEGKQRNELTFTVLTPQHRTPARFLYGLLTGVASTSYRQPFSTRLVFVREGSHNLTRNHLRSATILDAEDKSIPSEVRDYLRCCDGAVMFGGEG
jgi:transcriptional regulator with XRE-family HTH domain